MPDIPDPETASTGYYLGAQLLAFIAPPTKQKTITVPVSLDASQREAVDGVLDRDVIAAQTAAALEILNREQPERIVTLGGECSVSVPPFSYLAARYQGDIAIVWLDAHPDLNLPGDAYRGYHAMALAACLGLGDQRIVGQLPGRVDPSRALIVGLRSWDSDAVMARKRELGVAHLDSSTVAETSEPIVCWLRESGASRVLVHLDLDVLEPSDLFVAVGREPGGLTLEQTVRIVNDVAAACELVGLTVAEPMPRAALRLRAALARLPLMQ